MSGILTFRPLSSQADYRACTSLQEEVWGEGFFERVSPAILMIANRLGGLSAGAFDSAGTLQGFVFGFTGIVDGEVVHWSDMLAVRPEIRDRGLGTRLKKYQREFLLEQGIRRMYWTFDPLQSRNAYVNFSKLGIVSRQYVQEMYGHTDSPLHDGVGTDRLLASWEMDSHRVRSRLAGEEPALNVEAIGDLPRALEVEGDTGLPAPGKIELGCTDPRILLNVPRDIDGMMREDLPLAIRWREATRLPFLHYLANGYEVREFVRLNGVSGYVLECQEAQSAGGEKGDEAGRGEALDQ